jgi:hypothetical protein
MSYLENEWSKRERDKHDLTYNTITESISHIFQVFLVKLIQTNII